MRLLEAVLRHRGAEETIVAVCLQRTPALVVALLGILFAGRVVLIVWAWLGLKRLENGKFLVQASLHWTIVCQVACSLNHHVLQMVAHLPAKQFCLQKADHTNAFKQPPCFPYLSFFQVLHISPWSQHIREHDYASCWRIPWPVAWWLVGVHDAGTWCRRCRPWMAMNGRGQNQMRRLNEKDWTSSPETIYIHIIYIYSALHSYCFFFSGLLHLIV